MDATATKPTELHTAGGASEVLRGWSSLIGIVTAIVGNVLIALALNVQRYAHMRLRRERTRVRQRARRGALAKPSSRSAGDGGGGSYGTMAAAATKNGHDASEEDDKASARPVGTPRGVIGVSARDEARRHEVAPLSDSFPPTPSADDDDVNGHEETGAASNYLKSPYWWLGQILITVGELGNFLAYGFAPASIVSPLGVVALASNCIIAPAMFHERFRAKDFGGVVIAMAGVVTVVLSANQEETRLEPHDVWDAITTMAFEIYLGVSIFLIGLLMWASSRHGRRTILIDLGLVGLFGGYTALATKGVSSMLSSTLWGAFATPVTYALLFVLLVTAVMQIRYVNKALQRFDSTQVIPIQFVLFTLCVILGSAILYRDFERTTPQQAACFVGGCLLTFFGVFLLTSGRQQEDLDRDKDDVDLLVAEVDGFGETIDLRRHEEALGAAHESQSCCATPKAQSRRSSRRSRVSFADAGLKAGAFRDADPGALPRANQWASESAPHLIGVQQPFSTTAEPPRRDTMSSSSSVGRNHGKGACTDLAAAAAAAAAEHASTHTADESSMTAPMRDPGITLMFPSEQPPATPRPGTGTTSSRGPSTPGPHHAHPNTFISPSPLSSTVTRVVKDAFLRDTNHSPAARKSSLRRIRSSLRASLFLDGGGHEGDRPADGDEDSGLDDGVPPSRSVGDAPGGVFRFHGKSERAGGQV